MALGEHPGQFIANPLARDSTDPSRQLLDCSEGSGFDRVPEAGGKAYRAQHAQLVFGEAQLRPPDGANDSGFEVLASADEIQHFILNGIEQQAVDGKVAALDIFLSALAEAYLVGMAAVAVADVAAEGGYFNRVLRVVF